MKLRSGYLYLALFAVHVLIAMVAFIHFRLHPYDTLFPSGDDGLKNLYTMISYVKEPLTADGIFKYNSFQYPIGDYVYYTDNTPLFSIPFRWFCLHIYDASDSVIVAFYVFVILNIIAGGMALYYILRALTKHTLVSFLLAVVMPWTNMQLIRVWRGHFNLSFTLVSLLAICLFMEWHRRRGRVGRQLWVAAGMCLLALLSFLAHGYYLAIVTLFMAGMVFFYGFAGRSEPWGRFSMAAAPAIAFTSVGLSLLVVYVTDRYFSLRKDHPGGYDWMEQKVRFTALFSGYTFQRFSFPVMSGRLSDEPEKAAYLGNIGLYLLLVIGVGICVSRGFRAFFIATQRSFFSQPLLAAIAGGALLLLVVSFGENYYTADPTAAGMHIVNIFNPLFYVHQVTRAVEQFRSLERFVFPFYFGFYIWAAYMLAAIYNANNQKIKIIIVVAIVGLGGVEIADHVDKMQSSTGGKNIFSPERLLQEKPTHIDARRYQALLPIPFYQKGPDDDDVCIADYEDWVKYTFQISLATRLPMMAMKMDRTPPLHGKMMIDMVGYGRIDPFLRSRLGNKPVLIAVNKRFKKDSSLYNVPHDNGIREEHYWRCNSIVERNGLTPIDSVGDVFYYEWYPLTGK